MKGVQSGVQFLAGLSSAWIKSRPSRQIARQIGAIGEKRD